MAEASARIADAPISAAKKAPAWAFYLIFIVSGLSGLIYESIWSRYLKLFLGHDALAQTLVLVIFLLGLALGSALASRYANRIANPLLAYAIVEAIVAVAGVYFHDVFTAATGWAYTSLLPAVGEGTPNLVARWGLATLLIFPQTILLGTTFPLMSVGVIRLYPASSGRTISWLYFSNSIGAAAGVLISGFFLVDLIGLPGTVLVGGLLSGIAGLAVWGLHHAYADRGVVTPATDGGDGRVGQILLAVAALTGMASFIYEIAWIRMLTLLIGSTAHAFELMLSAFILGLALGGFWIRRRLDALKSPMRTLAVVQLLMGTFAIATLFFYEGLFELVAIFYRGVPRQEEYYAGYQMFQYAMAMLMMLPATICAGMTLPLMTNYLFKSGEGERAVGRVYAANTLGAIVGVVAAVYLLMPAVGLKNTVLVGGAIDVLLGVLIALRFARPVLARICAAGAAAVAAGIAWGSFSPGIYIGVSKFSTDLAARVIHSTDGLTASIAVTSSPKTRAIFVNGLSQSAISVPLPDPDSEEPLGAADDIVNVLTGLVPLMFRPDAETAANVGFGTGLTSETILHSSRLRHLDSIEIEAEVIRAAEHLRPSISRALDDPRHRIRIDDARAFFATRAVPAYDVIISEPPQIWRKGIPNLFTSNYYRTASDNLREGGIFTQWIQLYGVDVEIVSSIFKALAAEMGEFKVFRAGSSNLLVVAARKGEDLPDLSGRILEDDEIAEFVRPWIRHPDDVRDLYLGGREALLPLFEQQDAPPNSDYFPFVESASGKSYFLNRFFSLPRMQVAAGFAFVDMLEGAPRRQTSLPLTENIVRSSRSLNTGALAAQRLLDADNPPRGVEIGNYVRDIDDTVLLDGLLEACPSERDEWLRWIAGVRTFVRLTHPFARPAESQAYWRRNLDRCLDGMPDDARPAVLFFRSLALWDFRQMAAMAEQIEFTPDPTETEKLMIAAAAVANLRIGRDSVAAELRKLLPEDDDYDAIWIIAGGLDAAGRPGGS